jgi:Uncharacterized protein conserved in bacteria
MSTFIALLRGINVGGRNKIPMQGLRALCESLGWTDVQTYIQSGNVIFRAGAVASALEHELEPTIERELGFSIPVLVRAAADWPVYVQGNPFPDVSMTEPNRVMLVLSKRPPRHTAVDELRERAEDGEQIARVGDALWFYYAGGAGKSKLSPALLDRLVGSFVTARNWRTVLKLEDLARQTEQ